MGTEKKEGFTYVEKDILEGYALLILGAGILSISNGKPYYIASDGNAYYYE